MRSMRIAFIPALFILLAAGVFLPGVQGGGWDSPAEPTSQPAGRAYFPVIKKDYPWTISGYVEDEQGPIQGASVRIRTTENKTTSAEDGSFELGDLAAGVPVSVTAWADGYYVGWASTIPGAEPVKIRLRPYYTDDNPDYEWFSHEGDPGSLSCSHCMACYTEWQADAHSGSAVNPRFVSMYNGTDLEGNQSPLTQYECTPDYGCFPLPPDPALPYYGPGYKLDFPESAGNCATCHAPAAALNPGTAYSADINSLSGIELEGVFCEYCHKIGEVTLNPQTGLPYTNLPGVLSQRLFRPPEGEQLFFGNFDDVTRRVSYLPLEEESAFCAACHYGVFWDVPVYNSYGEWLESPYSDAETGKTCQDCHMPGVDYDYFVFPESGGLWRDRQRIFSHRMPGATDQDLLQNALTLKASAAIEGDELRVSVTVTNDKTGHHVPTDSPLRHLILVVNASDQDGNPLVQTGGPTIPDWAGVGDPQAGYYAGLPGTAYAKILEELWTGVAPSGAYWNQTRILSDNRLAAFTSDRTMYAFRLPTDPDSGTASHAAGGAYISIRLLFRRAFIELTDQKGWTDPDVLMENLDITIFAE